MQERNFLHTVATCGRTQKLPGEGVHRAESLERTIKAVLRFAPIMGITRVANVTGLDCLGLPVVMVSRPNSRSVAVSQGKGVTLAAARASGLMEAAELYHAETMAVPLYLANYEELRYRHTIAEIAQLPRLRQSRFAASLRLPWCTTRDLLSGETVLVPYEIVHTDFTLPLPDGSGCFPASSNGLASGNNLLEAISHGICELVERDAAALWKLGSVPQQEQRRLDLETVDDPTCVEVLATLRRAGISVAIWDITSDIGLPCFACVIVPEKEDPMWHSVLASGYGCHLVREVAMLRALTEAAQGRLTVIAGVRDDFGQETYDRLSDVSFTEAVRQRVQTSSARRSFCEVPTCRFATLEEDVACELELLRKAGLQRVLVADLTKPEFGLPVVRVIVPGLEPMITSGCEVGARGRAILAKHG